MGRPSLTTCDASIASGWPLRSLARACMYLFSTITLLSWLTPAAAMRPGHKAKLRQETVDLFYHGFENYMRVAFPEDELRPISCTPLTRDPKNPRNVELNDVLGNYSLTLIDSLSTLAIIASAPPDDRGTGPKALNDFQNGVAALVDQYGDGRPGPSGRGLRGRGFDVDSKVQVFETVIRGVGGLLSAHLFAIGELPITGYNPNPSGDPVEDRPILWSTGFKYDGQLLRLALDLAQRLLPAFYTTTGLPYPRVNLRHGIPFYTNSPLHDESSFESAGRQGPPEITETCSAGAGSLVLEFTVLSRLTGDQRFEQAAKRAFWAVWERRSDIGLIGAGVDAEAGHWVGPYAGIGAGADSFFEYALKTHILLSGHELPNQTLTRPEVFGTDWLDPNDIYAPLTVEENSADTFLRAWHSAHAAIKRHLYTGSYHPHYINANLVTGSPQAFWIDSLGAYYSGLLTLAGELDEAIETNLLYTALWTRFSALPERWSVRDNNVEGGLGWWPGRPEFIESTYYLYRATQDPWYLYVGEMVLRDITRRCYTECGWAGLQDVRTGEKNDRMESFFLGETAKYMYLLFDERHPLNSLDASFVFTTEGHPLIIPRKKGSRPPKPSSSVNKDLSLDMYHGEQFTHTCPAPPLPVPLTVSSVASRPDIFHAAKLVGLHTVPNIPAGLESGQKMDPSMESSQKIKSTYTYFPWTLPTNLVPSNATCAPPPLPKTFLIEFPANTQQSLGSAFNFMFGPHNLARWGNEGILVHSLSGQKFTLLQDAPPENDVAESQWRVSSIGGVNLGRDEKIFITRDVIGDISDPLFRRVRETTHVDLIMQFEVPPPSTIDKDATGDNGRNNATVGQEYLGHDLDIDMDEPGDGRSLASEYKSLFTSLLRALRNPNPTSSFSSSSPTSISPKLSSPPSPSTSSSDENDDSQDPVYQYISIVAITPTGVGAVPLPDSPEAPHLVTRHLEGEKPHAPMSWTRIYSAGLGCSARLPDSAPRDHQVIVIRRGGCSFSEKLANIPAFAPGSRSLQLVVIVSDEEDETGNMEAALNIRPLLDVIQMTPSGIPRRRPIPMLMVGGGERIYELLVSAKSVGFRRRYHIESQGLLVENIVVL